MRGLDKDYQKENLEQMQSSLKEFEEKIKSKVNIDRFFKIKKRSNYFERNYKGNWETIIRNFTINIFYPFWFFSSNNSQISVTANSANTRINVWFKDG